jgi:hypothetical protein
MEIIVGRLHELPAELAALRHTYLRVLTPILKSIPLRSHPYHRLEELKIVLKTLENSATEDETLKRLIERGRGLDWYVWYTAG